MLSQTLSIGQTKSKGRHLQRLLLCLSCRQCPWMLQRTQKLLFADEIHKTEQNCDSSLLGIFRSTLMSPERTLPLAFSSVLSKGPFLIRQRAYCSPAQIIYECVLPRWNDTDRATERLGEKPVLVSLCPQQIPHVLTRDRKRVSAATNRLSFGTALWSILI
jgi:hypothetical protein